MGLPWKIDPTTHRTMIERSAVLFKPTGYQAVVKSSANGHLGTGSNPERVF